MTTTTGESAVKANSSEAQRLYQRGIAAARGGQRRVAAGLLTRSVQLDPHNERAWLWLSGVLDNPRQQAFCLNAALKINPQNEHALRGLRLLEERQLLADGPLAAPGLATPSGPPAPAAEARPQSGEAWWVSWRRNRHEMRWARLILWALPLVLLASALALFHNISALAQERARPPAPTAAPAAAPSPEPARPSVEPILEAEPLAVVEGLTVGYLAAIEPLRAELRSATAAYRAGTTQPGGASVGNVAATQRLRAAVEAGLAGLDELRPPATLQQAHADYRAGLELELEGLDALLEFYGSYDVANANRAAQRFQEARAYIERALAGFSAQAQQLADLSAMSSHTAR